MEPNAAIDLFNKCRGHPIERANYIQDLQKRALKKSSCEVKNPDSDLRKKGSAAAKPQKQLVKPPLAVPRNPGSSKKQQWPGPTAQEQPQELGHRHRALGQGQLEQRQLKKLEQKQLEQNHPEQRQQKKLDQRLLEQLEQMLQKKLEQRKLEQNHLEQNKQKKLEQNHLEQKKQKKL
ncbi:hypothetical protein Nmel_018565, partial [Mimus melanotis]